MSVDTQYAYAVARIRAVEKKLLDKAAIDRIVDAKSTEDAFKAIVAAGYGASDCDTADPLGYERFFKEEMKKTHMLLREIAPEPDVFDIFLQRSDYHNIKALLKAEFSDYNDDSALMDEGTIPVGRLRSMIRDRDMSGMPQIMRDAAFEAIDVFNRTKDPQAIDIVLDRACFVHMKELALNSGSSFLVDIVSILIDLTNIKIFLRAKKLKEPRNFLQKSLLVGGIMDKELFFESLEEPMDRFISILSYKPYSTLVKGVEDFKNTGSLTMLEKLSDNYVMSYIKKALFTAFGLEPLVGYLLAREIEVKNLRIVMVGKINNIPGDIIRERLRDTYV